MPAPATKQERRETTTRAVLLDKLCFVEGQPRLLLPPEAPLAVRLTGRIEQAETVCTDTAVGLALQTSRAQGAPAKLDNQERAAGPTSRRRDSRDIVGRLPDRDGFHGRDDEQREPIGHAPRRSKVLAGCSVRRSASPRGTTAVAAITIGVDEQHPARAETAGRDPAHERSRAGARDAPQITSVALGPLRESCRDDREACRRGDCRAQALDRTYHDRSFLRLGGPAGERAFTRLPTTT